jgi:hypothetical protein
MAGLALIVAVMVLFDLAAMRYGADSRHQPGDERRGT